MCTVGLGFAKLDSFIFCHTTSQDMSSRPVFSAGHEYGLRFCRGSIFLHDFPLQRPWSCHTYFLKLYGDTGEVTF